ncbi:hypothetical protein ACFQZ8_12820 [Micromonospora azadirachtae]|uniref:Uncharacterized protein n=1 Tax=Micromonospora azadirachtae TaxID=1970735 RepID=A0ABW3A1J2_9ACTN
MIDLDERNHQPAETGTTAHDRLVTRRKMVLGFVAVFVVGVALGGFAVQRRDSRDQRERNATVALVAIPQSASLGSPSFQTATIGGRSGVSQVKLTGHLMLINAGPAPISVRGVAVEGPGMASTSSGQPRLPPLGGTGQLVVELLSECSVAAFEEPLQLIFAVETEDKKVREVGYPVTLAGSDWQRVAMSSCEHA